MIKENTRGFLMNIIWRKQDKDMCIDWMMNCLDPEDEPMTNLDAFQKNILHTYPELKQIYTNCADWKLCEPILRQKLSDIWDSKNTELDSVISEFNRCYDESKKDRLLKAFSNAFHTDITDISSITVYGNIGMNPICPRYLKEKSFDVFYTETPKKALQIAIHEITHFIWFDIWNKHFKDSYEEYEYPSLKWALSEMVADTLIKNSDLINFWDKSDNSNTIAYSYWYSMQIANRSILYTLKEMYKSCKSITDFMEVAYKYCCDNEKELRNKIQTAEN